jgi:hypothetical protein
MATARQMARTAAESAYGDAVSGGCSDGEAARRASVEWTAALDRAQENLRSANIWIDLAEA